MKIKMMIYECKLKVQNWYSSWILVCCFFFKCASRMPQIAQILVLTLNIFGGKGGMWGGKGGGGGHAPGPPRNFLPFFFH